MNSPRRRPRGCHGRRPRARRVLGRRRHPGLGRAPSIVGHAAEPAAGLRGALALLRPASRVDRLRGRAVRDASRCPSTTTARQGDTIELAVVRVPAAGGVQAPRVARRQPGGARRVRASTTPGRPTSSSARGCATPTTSSGSTRAASAARRPIDCVTDAELDAFLGSDPTPDDAAEEQAFAATARGFAQSCGATAGPLLAHVSTRGRRPGHGRAAGRARRGEAHLPRQVVRHLPRHGLRRPVPRAASAGWCSTASSPPTSPPRSSTSARPRASSSPPAQWAAYCVEQGDCPLGDSRGRGDERLRTFLTSVDQSPLPRTGDNAVPRLTEGWASLGIAAAMYDQGAWQTLVDAMGEAVGGRRHRPDAARRPVRRPQPGRPVRAATSWRSSTPSTASTSPTATTSPSATAWREESLKEAPDLGPVPHVELAAVRRLAGQGHRCAREDLRRRAPTRSSSSAPPATRRRPTSGRCGCATSSPTPRCITFDGDGHTAYTRSNECVDGAVDALLPQGHRAQGRAALLSPPRAASDRDSRS